MPEFMDKPTNKKLDEARRLLLEKGAMIETEECQPEITRDTAEEAIKNILWYVGEDAEREGLLETPARVVKAWDELLSGYTAPSDEEIMKTFEDGGEDTDEMVLVRDIKLQSFCEHHMIPFFGVAHVAYIPNGRIVGLSKINRIVDKYMRRLQVQERLTSQIANAINDALHPLGVAVMIEASHLCVCYRGIKDVNSLTRTTSLKGVFKMNAETRSEFLDGCRKS
jgi:GTP cyclohydrolase I